MRHPETQSTSQVSDGFRQAQQAPVWFLSCVCGWSGRCLYLRMARETFCFHGLSFLIPIPNPERKKSSPVVTRSHFCDASNSNTALSQMKAWSLLREEEDVSSQWRHIASHDISLWTLCLLTCLWRPGWPQQRSRSCVSPCAGTWCSAPPAVWNRYPPSSASLWRRWTYLMGYAAVKQEHHIRNELNWMSTLRPINIIVAGSGSESVSCWRTKMHETAGRNNNGRSLFQTNMAGSGTKTGLKGIFRCKFNPCSNTQWYWVRPPSRDKVCGPLAYVVLASSETTAQQH